ncbi:hypothetical protein ASPZODRAFT_133121 [Penicilliopsis zonata CBS 506.65]|uniref:HCP-like protein n=1 Tax=Penicilliopsis zonata CBS 506.65 TaxID=1073090 RepID=A0A1L9SGF1_9EURO|nr:hypothetical protein ASPZODRAFT_133121 [Penicilliopsis zonata CBS 506.65]OJJ46124.1 hypothetical protein ASPZODRAFT_133121 [Penicilliopsis zonata CBS 506.65]
MPLRDFLRRGSEHQSSPNDSSEASGASGYPDYPQQPVPEIKFVRSDTTTQEVITPPVYEGDYDHQQQHEPEQRPSTASSVTSSSSRRGFKLFHRSRSPSDAVTTGIEAGASASPPRPQRDSSHRLSSLLHRDRDRAAGSGGSPRNSSSVSVNLPRDLPRINTDVGDKQDREAQWEKRATVLVQGNPQFSSPLSPTPLSPGENWGARSRSSSRSGCIDRQGDVNIQEAIRLHENGELEKSTQMFGQLADPNGANNTLSQVLYGLALRHGWGCVKNEEQAVVYLQAAATNSASIESEALRSGMKKGGAAKGELVLAIFELANCFRNGWGLQKDPVAARQYYETAANLGDTDAMNEAAWCYLEGFGGKKDKYTAAKYYRLAEEHGSKTLGNSWIWKDKYNPK